jgi:hypothetical protein
LFRISIFEFQISSKRDLSLFVTGGAAGGGAATAGRTSSALKLTTAGKGKGRHHPMNFFAFTFRTGDLFRGIEN